MNEKFKSFLSYLREEATGGVNYHGIMPKYKFWPALQVDAMCVYVRQVRRERREHRERRGMCRFSKYTHTISHYCEPVLWLVSSNVV